MYSNGKYSRPSGSHEFTGSHYYSDDRPRGFSIRGQEVITTNTKRDLIPDRDGHQQLGSHQSKWKSVHTQKLYVDSGKLYFNSESVEYGLGSKVKGIRPTKGRKGMTNFRPGDSAKIQYSGSDLIIHVPTNESSPATASVSIYSPFIADGTNRGSEYFKFNNWKLQATTGSNDFATRHFATGSTSASAAENLRDIINYWGLISGSNPSGGFYYTASVEHNVGIHSGSQGVISGSKVLIYTKDEGSHTNSNKFIFQVSGSSFLTSTGSTIFWTKFTGGTAGRSSDAQVKISNKLEVHDKITFNAKEPSKAIEIGYEDAKSEIVFRRKQTGKSLMHIADRSDTGFHYGVLNISGSSGSYIQAYNTDDTFTRIRTQKAISGWIQMYDSTNTPGGPSSDGYNGWSMVHFGKGAMSHSVDSVNNFSESGHNYWHDRKFTMGPTQANLLPQMKHMRFVYSSSGDFAMFPDYHTAGNRHTTKLLMAHSSSQNAVESGIIVSGSVSASNDIYAKKMLISTGTPALKPSSIYPMEVTVDGDISASGTIYVDTLSGPNNMINLADNVIISGGKYDYAAVEDGGIVISGGLETHNTIIVSSPNVGGFTTDPSLRGYGSVHLGGAVNTSVNLANKQGAIIYPDGQFVFRASASAYTGYMRYFLDGNYPRFELDTPKIKMGGTDVGGPGEGGIWTAQNLQTDGIISGASLQIDDHASVSGSARIQGDVTQIGSFFHIGSASIGASEADVINATASTATLTVIGGGEYASQGQTSISSSGNIEIGGTGNLSIRGYSKKIIFNRHQGGTSEIWPRQRYGRYDGGHILIRGGSGGAVDNPATMGGTDGGHVYVQGGFGQNGTGTQYHGNVILAWSSGSGTSYGKGHGRVTIGTTGSISDPERVHIKGGGSGTEKVFRVEGETAGNLLEVYDTDDSGSLELSGSLILKNNVSAPAISESRLYNTGSNLYFGNHPIGPISCESFHSNQNTKIDTDEDFLKFSKDTAGVETDIEDDQVPMLAVANTNVRHIIWRSIGLNDNMDGTETATVSLYRKKPYDTGNIVSTAAWDEVETATVVMRTGNDTNAENIQYFRFSGSHCQAGDLLSVSLKASAQLQNANCFNYFGMVCEIDYGSLPNLGQSTGSYVTASGGGMLL